jgi:hypothetical protein
MKYTYIHFTTDGKAFYVGHGDLERTTSTYGRPAAWYEIAAKGFTVKISFESESKAEAREVEDVLIEIYRKLQHPLTNSMTNKEQMHYAQRLRSKAGAAVGSHLGGAKSRGKTWWTDGTISTRSFECPPGMYAGRKPSINYNRSKK